MSQAGKRTVYLDFIRILAIYMVLFNHTRTSGFVLFTVRRGSFFYPFYLFNAILIKSAVPLFFMVSGALLLGKEESYSQINNILRIGRPTNRTSLSRGSAGTR